MTARHMSRRFTLRLAFVAARLDAAHLTVHAHLTPSDGEPAFM